MLIHQVLTSIGLSPKEIKIYLLSLEYGPQPASNIAKLAKLKRPTVYDIFQSLIRKGLAHKVQKDTVQFFSVLKPEELENYLDREMEALIKEKKRQKTMIQNILPALKSIEPSFKARTKVKFYEGKNGMRQAYEDTLNSSEEIRAYVNCHECHQAFPDFFPDYYHRRTAKNIPIRGIMPDTPESMKEIENPQQLLRQVKVISHEQHGFSPEVNIYDEKVVYFAWKEELAVMIQSQEIAEFHKKMYDLLWEKLDSYESEPSQDL